MRLAACPTRLDRRANTSIGAERVSAFRQSRNRVPTNRTALRPLTGDFRIVSGEDRLGASTTVPGGSRRPPPETRPRGCASRARESISEKRSANASGVCVGHRSRNGGGPLGCESRARDRFERGDRAYRRRRRADRGAHSRKLGPRGCASRVAALHVRRPRARINFGDKRSAGMAGNDLARRGSRPRLSAVRIWRSASVGDGAFGPSRLAGCASSSPSTSVIGSLANGRVSGIRTNIILRRRIYSSEWSISVDMIFGDITTVADDRLQTTCSLRCPSLSA